MKIIMKNNKEKILERQSYDDIKKRFNIYLSYEYII
jgi:hypothetical protein